MTDQLALKNLNKIFMKVPRLNINESEKIVIFSDIHLGNGGRGDDFKKNSGLFKFVLENYYLRNNYKLVLNGDIEDLYKYPIKKVVRAWPEVFQLFEEFRKRNHLYKIVGNHDYELVDLKYPDINKNILRGLKLNFKNDTIFVYHGHQTSDFFDTYNKLSVYIVRFLVNPLKIKNTTFTLNSKKIFNTELRSYKFAANKKIISIIGHTHKPLFESLSKKDDLSYRIENLIRKYPSANEKKKQKIRKQVNKYKNELQALGMRNEQPHLRSKLHDDELLVPSLFNSGAVLGKRGFTCIEIYQGRISLVYWFDRNDSKRYIKYKGVTTEKFGETNFYKAILKSATLENIFTRIKLLA